MTQNGSNNPSSVTDPSGHKPCWATAHYSCDLSGGKSADVKRQDELIQYILMGSGPGGSWTDADWAAYKDKRNFYWANPDQWIHPDKATGWGLFALHTLRLYAHDQEAYGSSGDWQFVKDFALVFGGMPTASKGMLGATLASTKGPSVSNGHLGGKDFISFLYDSNAGLATQYCDTLKGCGDNQSHHYAGAFATGYFFSTPVAAAANYFGNQGNSGDIALGNGAINDSLSFALGSSIFDLIVQYNNP